MDWYERNGSSIRNCRGQTGHSHQRKRWSNNEGLLVRVQLEEQTEQARDFSLACFFVHRRKVWETCRSDPGVARDSAGVRHHLSVRASGIISLRGHPAPSLRARARDVASGASGSERRQVDMSPFVKCWPIREMWDVDSLSECEKGSHSSGLDCPHFRFAMWSECR